MIDTSYQDKTALVTGASSGLGLQIATELARRGAQVVLVARRAERLEQLATAISAEGGTALAMPCDLADETAVRELARSVKKEVGRVQLLVNNAGRDLIEPLQTTKRQAIRDLLEVNFVALADLTRNCIPLLKAGSAVVNVSSVAALTGEAGISIYSASKAAILAFTRSLAKELAARRVRVNAVAPGMVATELLDSRLNRLTPEQAADLEASHPLGFGAPGDVASAVAFLGSDEATWITGQTLVLDGGFSL